MSKTSKYVNNGYKPQKTVSQPTFKGGYQPPASEGTNPSTPPKKK